MIHNINLSKYMQDAIQKGIKKIDIQPVDGLIDNNIHSWMNIGKNRWAWALGDGIQVEIPRNGQGVLCPYGVPGDRILVDIVPPIYLEVERLKIQRLQEISVNEAIAYGLIDEGSGQWWLYAANQSYNGSTKDPILSFESLWNSLNPKSFAWKSNPWVWIAKLS